MGVTLLPKSSMICTSSLRQLNLNLTLKVVLPAATKGSFKPVFYVIKLFWRNSRFPKNLEIEKSSSQWLNLHKNVKNAIFKQNYPLKLCITVKIAYFISV